MALVASIVLAAVLIVAAVLKLRAFAESASALATFDVPAALRRPATVAVVALELVIAVALVAGVPAAPYAGAALLLAFAAVTSVALLRGKRGAPCGCFGARSRIGAGAVLRDVALAAAFVTVPFLPEGAPSTTGWLWLALALAFACIAGLAVAVLALAREVGLLRLRLAPELALDIAGEGPPLGSQVELARPRDARLTLAVFSSEGCRLCRALQPSLAALGKDPAISLLVFDEVRDADIWRRLNVPGSPYAVVVGEVGEVRAKGTFNTHGQLEAIVAAAA
ncbi:MAG TPA: MauE/DoxX family redox-associated membrane protein [Gaiellaceae bacterium]|nr:MauE/DoxX family redox-associated membrane protein [Gaiellaceae bacterium]